MILYNLKLIRNLIGGEWYKVSFEELTSDFIFRNKTLWTRNFDNYKKKPNYQLLKIEIWRPL